MIQNLNKELTLYITERSLNDLSPLDSLLAVTIHPRGDSRQKKIAIKFFVKISEGLLIIIPFLYIKADVS